MLYEQPRVVRQDECDFYHVMDLPKVGQVGGQWDLRGRFEDYTGHVPMNGKRVLDVGAASGFLTFEAEKHGADVVSFDADSASRVFLLPLKDDLFHKDRKAWIESYEPTMRKMHNGYWFTHHLLGSKAKAVYGDVYEIPDEIGLFDVVLVGQILVHLSDPVRALSSMMKRCRERIVITEGMITNEDPIAALCGRAENRNNWSWWHLSTGLYREIFKFAGFEIEKIANASYKFAAYNSSGEAELTTIVAART